MEQESGEPAVESPKTAAETYPQNEQPTPETEAAPADKPEGETPPKDDVAEVKPKRRGGFQKKIERANERIAFLESLVAGKSQNPPAESENATTGRPARENYPNDDDYIEALTEWKADEVTDRKLNAREQAAKDGEKRKSYKAQAEEARKLYPDFDAVVSEYNDVHIREDIVNSVLESPIGAEINYYLASHPDELDAINAAHVSSLAVAKAIGRIEARIEQGKTTGGTATVKTTQAPSPITPVKAKATTANTPERAAEQGDHEAYRKARGFK